MALIKCKECGAEISTKAEACPKCGAKRPKPTSLVTWLIVGLFVYVIVQCSTIQQQHEKRAVAEQSAKTPEMKQLEANESAQSDAKWQCREFVKKTLKAPSTAEFQNYNDFSAYGTGNGPFEIIGYVDAQNSFGAKLRTQFTCKLFKSGSNWELMNLSTTP